MKRSPVLLLGIASLLIVLAAGGAVWNRNFRMPVAENLPVPEPLVSLQSPSGQKLIAGSEYVADYASLTTNFVAQSRRAYCGVASGVGVINAMRGTAGQMDQSTFFTEAAQKIKTPLQVTFKGMSLKQLGDLLQAHGASTTVIPASDTDLESFRRIAQDNLRTPGDFVLVHYQRAELGQTEGGHISPLAAYDPASDRFLILDVAAHKYPPVWASATTLWKAMSDPLNPSTRTGRGFLVVRKKPSALPLGIPSEADARPMH